MAFKDIPIRANGQIFFFDWFNSVRAAGIAIESFFGSSFIPAAKVTLTNNQGSAADVSGLLMDPTKYRSSQIFAEVRRKTDTNERRSCGRLIAVYRELTTTWDVIDELGGDDDGVVFSITSGGQIQYVSNNLSGTNYVGEIRFKAMVFDI